MADVLWCAQSTTKLYRQSGDFTSTIKTSAASLVSEPSGISTDGVHTVYCNGDAGSLGDGKIVFTSGIFSSTVRDSIDCSVMNHQLDGREGAGFGAGRKEIRDIDWDGRDTFLITARGSARGRVFKLSGRFSSIIRQSAGVPASGLQWSGISAVRDAEQRRTTLISRSMTGGAPDLYVMSGSFTDTVRQSLRCTVTLLIRPQSCSFDGTDGLIGGHLSLSKMARVSGVWSTTVLSSVSTGIGTIRGICSLNWEGRLAPRDPDTFRGRAFVSETDSRLAQVMETHEAPSSIDQEDSRQYQVAPLETA